MSRWINFLARKHKRKHFRLSGRKLNRIFSLRIPSFPKRREDLLSSPQINKSLSDSRQSFVKGISRAADRLISVNCSIARLIALVGGGFVAQLRGSIGSGAIRDDHYRPCRLVPISIYRNIRGVRVQRNSISRAASEFVIEPTSFVRRGALNPFLPSPLGLIANTGHISSFVGENIRGYALVKRVSQVFSGNWEI